MAQLLDLPEEVLESSILPHLPWNDLLRCRRVCKTIKGIADDYMRLNPQKAPEIEVMETSGKNLKAFIAMGIPTTKLFLNNPNGHHFYDNLDTATLNKFTATYGPMINSLRVEQLSLYPCFNEWTVLEALTNLKTFEAEGYGLGVVPSVEQRRQIERQRLALASTDPRFPHSEVFTYPTNFKNLEILKIGHNQQYCISDSSERFDGLLDNLPNLDYISFPFCSALEDQRPHPRDPFFDIIGKVMTSVFEKNKAEGQKQLKFLDFINYHEERGMKIQVIKELYNRQSFEFILFTGVCLVFSVKLLNVNPAWYQQTKQCPIFGGPMPPVYGIPVVSLVNLNACVIAMEMPNLERINICQTSRSNVTPTWNDRPDWPALKTLEINVNSKKAVETEIPTQDTGLLFKFLWKDIERGQLTELSLKFQNGKDGVAIPKTEDIASGCPNLRKLRIENWPGTNKQLTKLWNGLPGLEEVALEYCKDLGNVAFVGEDVNNPVFFRLEKLKKLTLKGLDQMPKITDTLFSLVLAKMKLSHLIIGSNKPLEKITQVGINALLEGEFAETIEKFPFHGWSLANMSAEDFQQMAKQFRSYDML